MNNKNILILSFVAVVFLIAFILFVMPASENQMLPEEYVMDENTSPTIEEPWGVYTASMPSASSPGRVITLQLESDVEQTATFTQDYQNDEDPIIEIGTWSRSSDGLIVVVLEDQTLEFLFEGEDIRLVNYDTEMWGSEGLTLTFAQSIEESMSENETEEEEGMREEEDMSTSDFENTEYTLIEYNGTAVAEAGYTVEFSDGSVSAKFCNTMGGEYTQEGGMLSGQLMSTLMFCAQPDYLMDVETTFAQMFETGVAVSEANGFLTLTGETGDELVFKIVSE